MTSLMSQSSNAEERQNIICDKLQTSVCCFKGVIYFYDVVIRVFKPIGNDGDKDNDVVAFLLPGWYTFSVHLVVMICSFGGTTRMAC